MATDRQGQFERRPPAVPDHLAASMMPSATSPGAQKQQRRDFQRLAQSRGHSYSIARGRAGTTGFS
jgi:hypothetical protein